MTLRKSLLPVFSALFLLYSLGLSLFSLEGFPRDFASGQGMPYLSDKPVGEDGYYMLSVAWNIAAERGISYNGGMPTTGIQPLSTFLYAGLAWLSRALGGDAWDFVRLTIFSNALAMLLFAVLVGRIARQLCSGRDYANAAFRWGFLLALLNFGLLRAFTYGLETGLYLILLAAALLFSIRQIQTRQPTPRQALLFGLLAGLCGLARLDFGIILFLFLLIAWLRRQFSFGALLLSGLAALAVVAPWFLYVHSVTGSWMPSSGGAQSALISPVTAAERLRVMGEAVAGHFTPWVYLNGSIMLLPALLSLGLLLWLLLHSQPTRAALAQAFQLPNALFLNWAAALLALLPVYLLFFWATHFYDRYTAPLLLLSLPLLGVFFAAWLDNRPAWLGGAAAVALCLLFFGWAFASLHTGRIGNSHSVTAGYIQQYFPAPARVGVFQSGVIGFYNPNVINLDGKVNQSALDAAAAGRLEEYLDSAGIEVLIDWPKYLQRGLDADYLQAGWQACPQPIPGGASLCYQRKP